MKRAKLVSIFIFCAFAVFIILQLHLTNRLIDENSKTETAHSKLPLSLLPLPHLPLPIQPSPDFIPNSHFKVGDELNTNLHKLAEKQKEEEKAEEKEEEKEERFYIVNNFIPKAVEEKPRVDIREKVHKQTKEIKENTRNMLQTKLLLDLPSLSPRPTPPATKPPPQLTPTTNIPNKTISKEISMNNATIGGKKITNNCYQLENFTECSPQFIIAGAMKCGTTSMYSYLSHHPKVLPILSDKMIFGKKVLADKEVRFWDNPKFSSYWGNVGVEGLMREYFDVFPAITPEEQARYGYITGEASPTYIVSEKTAKRIHQFLPEMKIILMFRNPVDRFYSELWFLNSLSQSPMKDQKQLKDTFEQVMLSEAEVLQYCEIHKMITKSLTKDSLDRCITSVLQYINRGACSSIPLNSESYQFNCSLITFQKSGFSPAISFSIYSLQLEDWLRYFERRSLKVVISEEFFDRPDVVMAEIERFLLLEPLGDWSSITQRKFNINLEANSPFSIVATSNDYPDMSDDTRHRLSKFFQPFNNHLIKLLNRAINW